jgi:hypothetical protein
MEIRVLLNYYKVDVNISYNRQSVVLISRIINKVCEIKLKFIANQLANLHGRSELKSYIYIYVAQIDKKILLI